jgi:hypothetical protein
MAKGISVHIGINEVDPEHYGGWDGALSACEFDAKDMQKIAKQRGFLPRLLLTSDATASAVQSAIRDAASQLSSGDFFWLTYSGHGGQVPDINHDEDEGDRQDETWVLYDRELIDDELYTLWSQFEEGVRILVLSDSCHSGTVTRATPMMRAANAGIAAIPPRNRLMPPEVAQRTYRRNRALYDRLQKATTPAEDADIKAAVLLISGCQDNQVSLDGSRNGLFTSRLRKVWASGKFKGGYRTFRNRIVASMPISQTPNYYKVGTRNREFERQKPFTI